MTNADYTDITVILDRSGSMQSIKTDTEGGFAAFIHEQAQLPGITTVSLVQFDDRYEQVYTDVAIDEVPTLVLNPRGSTALLDAIGKTVVATGERLAALPESERPGQVIVLVLTDGLENASREWKSQQVFDVVREQQNIYSWRFIFMGTDQNAIEQGAAMGFDRNASLVYAGEHVQDAFMSTSAAVSRSRMSGGSVSYSNAERSASVGAGLGAGAGDADIETGSYTRSSR